MPDTWSRRRALRAIATAAPLAIAGCGERTSPGTSTDGTTTAPDGDDRPTATERSPRPLDAAGTWSQFGATEGHVGTTDATGVPETGEPYWQLSRVRSGPPVLAEGRLFHYAKLGEDTGGRPTVTRTVEEPVGTAHPVYGEPALVARNARDGRIEWTRSLPKGSGGWPAVDDDRVIACVKGQVAAFDAASGDRRWRMDVGEHEPGNPTVVGDVAVVPFQGVVDGGSGEYVRRPSVRAYALDDGGERWSVEPPKRANGVAVVDETVVVVSGGWDGTGVVLGLARSDGGEQWRTETPGDSFPTPVAADGATYVGSDDYVRALDVGDGSERWRRELDDAPDGVAVDGETVYVAAGSSLSALAASDGSTDWQVTPAPDRESVVTVAVGNVAVYAGTFGNEAPLVALDPADGSERWSHGFPNKVVDGDMVMSGVEDQPVVADGGVYVNAVDGLYAFGPAE